jgi:hypothetical protein
MTSPTTWNSLGREALEGAPAGAPHEGQNREPAARSFPHFWQDMTA